MTRIERRKFIEFLDDLMAGNELTLQQPIVQQNDETLGRALRREIKAAKVIKEKLQDTEVMEG